MTHKQLNRIIAAAIFLVAEVVYLSTMAPTLSFWDCGEVIATSYTLGIPHPPGAPFYLLVGHLFSLLPFFHDIGARINFLSTIISSATVMLAYLIIVRLVAISRSSGPDAWSLPEKISAYGGAAVGALALAFSESFWFNAVETSLWSGSSLLTASIVWMMLCWYDEDPAPGSGRWLLGVMYMIGLSIGVHLLCLLALFSVAMVYYFKKYEVRGVDFAHSLPTAVIGSLVLYVTGSWLLSRIWPSGIPGPFAFGGFAEALVLMGIPAAIAFYLLKFYGDKAKKGSVIAATSAAVIVFCSVLYLLSPAGSIALSVFVLSGYGVYLLFVTPRSLLALVWGSVGGFFLIYKLIIKGIPVLLVNTSWWGLIIMVALLVTGIYLTRRNNQPLPHLLLLSVLLLVIGYTTYMLIFVRAHAGPPINENDPSTLKAFFSYVNREQYGEWPLWPRQWSQEPVNQYYYQKYSGDLDYFFRYQLDSMYLRYFGWQFIGRSGDMEGAMIDWSRLWGLPFLAGLFGAWSHFRKNWKMAMVVAALFLMTGLILVVYLNQPEPQPRERDYSYVGSFFAFSLWIGIGVEALFSRIAGSVNMATLRNSTMIAAAVVVSGLLLIDGRMLVTNYATHDRSGNYVPWDWAWNVLQSCDKDAILFTNGDNDTFPLWYLQEVGHIRTDVRVVNLSLANTGWYLLQLKHERPRGARPVNLTIADAELEAITYVPVDSIDVSVPAGMEPRRLYDDARRSGVGLPGAPSDSLRWRIRPGVSYQGQSYMRPQDIAVYAIVVDNYGRRPIYFALTVDPSEMIGLDRNLRLDGLVYRVVPLRSDSALSFVDPGTLYGNLFNTYRYRNTGNPSVSIEETSRNLLGNYPPLFVRLALDLAADPDRVVRVPSPSGTFTPRKGGAVAQEVLDRYARHFPLFRYPVTPRLAGSVASLYAGGGAKQKAYPYIHYLEILAAQTDIRQEPELYYTLAQAYRAAGKVREADGVMNQMKRALPDLRKGLDSLKQQQ